MDSLALEIKLRLGVIFLCVVALIGVISVIVIEVKNHPKKRKQ